MLGLAFVLPDERPAPLTATAAPAPRFPATLPDPEPRALLVAMAQSLPRIRQLETKEASGEVVSLDASGRALDLKQAAQQLRQIKQNLAALSHDGLPTYALIQSIAGDGRLEGWIIFPDGRIAAGRSARKFTGMGQLLVGLDVTRFALSRAPQLKSEPERPLLDAATDAESLGDERGRRSRIAKRRATLEDTAALPVAGPGDVAARRWSFMVMQDIPTLASTDFGFNLAALDLRKSVVVGDPDDMRDVRYHFKPLPGARRDALAIARDLELAGDNVLIGADATRSRVVSAIDRSNGEGMVYMATHAVSDEKNPLTRGFVVLSKTNLFAGELRVTRFHGWDDNHPLVVLSACQTALGRVFDGGTFGVARIWTNAGAGQVVASLWNVSDAATLKLMERFAFALKAGQSPEQAMQTAQLAALKDYLDDPRLWASFTIIGKPTLASGG